MTPYTVILPAFNEEAAIAPVIDAIRALPGNPEVIVVDDGSTDTTADIARQHGATVVRHPGNAGYGKSVMDGISVARNDIIVITDADGTYPIERIPEFVAKIEEGFDMAVGARSGKAYRGTFLKMPARIVLKFLVEFVTGRTIPDINSGLRSFRKSTVTPYFPHLCQGFSFTTTITLIYMLTGKIVTYVPIAYHKRVGSSKVRIIRDSLRTLQYVTEVVATYNPLKLFLLLSVLSGAFGALLLLLSCVWISPALIALGSVFVLGAVLLFGIGLQTEALRQR
ncbi:MAG TPA: glycosyltransferase family 2 protein [Candidatus Peribacteria bacterium]|nr:glycosyltransferase family 2 protein [Candidatus Peribacteria bacterium]